MFHDRADELATLERRWRSGKGELVVIWGRRRVGKTELIQQFMRGKRGLCYEASASTAGVQLEDLSRQLAELTGRRLFATQPLAGWEAFFDVIAEEMEKGPLVVALDEFQFIARESADVGSRINVFWRRAGHRGPILLILSGSDVSFFEREVMGYTATTYGRRTGSLRLRPFGPFEVHHFAPSWSAGDLVRAYAALGGMPYYLETLDEAGGLAESLLGAVLAPGSRLHDEPDFLFMQQTTVREPKIAYSILRAIAAGKTKQGEIAGKVGIPVSNADHHLAKLRELGFVTRLWPITATGKGRGRLVRYAIADPFLRFWFRFVHPFRDRLIHPDGARRHLEEHVLPHMDEFVSAPAFEEVCQQWLLRHGDVASVGWWWGNVEQRSGKGVRALQREVDVVGVDPDGHVTALGSCKWTEGVLPRAEKDKLEQAAQRLCPPGELPRLYFFSRSGFDAELRRWAKADPDRYRLVSVDDLWR